MPPGPTSPRRPTSCWRWRPNWRISDAVTPGVALLLVVRGWGLALGGPVGEEFVRLGAGLAFLRHRHHGDGRRIVGLAGGLGPAQRRWGRGGLPLVFAVGRLAIGPGVAIRMRVVGAGQRREDLAG